LVVAPYLPWPADFGGALRTYHLMRGLAARHHVTLLAPMSGDELDAIRHLGSFCDVSAVPSTLTARQPADRRRRLLQLRALASGRAALGLGVNQPQIQATLDQLFLTRRIDVVQFEFPESARYRLPEPKPTVFDAHNIEHELLQRVARTSGSPGRTLFNHGEWRKMRWAEERAWRAATVCVATSARDAERISATTGREALVVPNGVDPDHFRPSDAPVKPGRIVFVGALRHQPNANGALWFVRDVLPRVRRSVPDATLALVGADPSPAVLGLASSVVTVTGKVEDVRPWLAEAAVVVVPLFAGGGTRLKILEALAMAKPVVSTSIGAEGLDLNGDEHLVLADDRETFANAVRRLLANPEEAQALGQRGREAVLAKYAWHSSVAALEHAHQVALERSRSGSSSH
jgi:glycosyltransferase involved in cell wall biosynthesis